MMKRKGQKRRGSKRRGNNPILDNVENKLDRLAGEGDLSGIVGCWRALPKHIQNSVRENGGSLNYYLSRAQLARKD